ncbi:MAG: hypothetical protein NW224_26120 [Leptolyngbyaceae cyanobacterium bins.302]|nr:hypothetical protein [Leptolyngbyaceae cyanobacterium bins.302]
MTDRLDRIEAILEQLAATQAENWQQFQQQLQESREEFQRQWQETRQIVESNARAIAANSSEIAEMRRAQDDFRASIEDIVGMITTQVEEAERDRIEFRQTVQTILDALTRRFNSNGHGND